MKFSVTLLIVFLSSFLFSQAEITLPVDGKSYLNNFKKLGLTDKDIQFVPDRFNDLKGAIRLNGSSSFINFPVNINDDSAPEVSISLWVKADRIDIPMTLISNDNGNYDRTVAIDGRGSNQILNWSVFAGKNQVVGCQKVEQDKWTFIFVTFSASKNMTTLYVDGKKCTTSSFYDQGLNNLTFGVNPTFGGWFSGAIDDIVIEFECLDDTKILQRFEKSKKGARLKTSEQQAFSSVTDDRADLLVQVGDIDNLGFGWPLGFDPFEGKSTPIHSYPYYPSYSDFPGTDKIMIGSSYKGKPNNQTDGYTSTTKRPDNLPTSITLQYIPPAIGIKDATLVIFIDDFQAPVFKSYFEFSIDGKRLKYIENILNNIRQTGPVGKLITVGLLPEDLSLLKDGLISISIDDKISGQGDGYAIDFVQLLINKKNKKKNIGTITGVVTEVGGKPLKNVLIQSSGINSNITTSEGIFTISKIPFGLASLSFSKIGYDTKQVSFDLIKSDFDFGEVTLKPTIENESFIKNNIEKRGSVNLYGIRFDTDSTTPNKQSESSLNNILDYLLESKSNIVIIGHTDSDGEEKYNLNLSLERANSIKTWLVSKGISPDRLKTTGAGENNPISNNITKEGKSLNRRVELKIN